MQSPPIRQVRTLTVALVGNPNTGKSTLFNGLSGLNQRVGNYPGVTVEKKIGSMKIGDQSITLVDLPGTYSLAPRSPDEMIAVDVLLSQRRDVGAIDVVLCIVDAGNLERNLYLVSQVLELGLPTVLALNMTDVAELKGIKVDAEELAQRLDVAVVPVQANRRIGLDKLKQALAEAAHRTNRETISPFPETFQREVESLTRSDIWNGAAPPRFLVERLLLDVSGYLEQSGIHGLDRRAQDTLAAARGRLRAAGCPVPAVEAMSRYRWAASILDGVVTRPTTRPTTFSDRLDRLLTHRVFGLLFFVLVMLALFQSVFWVAEPASGLIDGAKGWLSTRVESLLDEGPLRSLVTSGIIEGVGSVLVFLPQIFVLFLFIAVLEDCGYMARAAYLMDRLMAPMGLSGKSFIPLLSSFACAIPGIMASRVIENRRDRLTTILIAPLMSCSARLPVYSLLIQAFIPDRPILGPVLSLRGLTMFSMYALGVLTAIVVALVLKRTILRGPTPAFVMELPSYKLPELRIVVYRMLERGWAFVRRAGTLIFAVSVLVWALAYYPHTVTIPTDLQTRRSAAEDRIAKLQQATDATNPDQQRALAEAEAEAEAVNNQIRGEYLRQSYLGRMGRVIEPVVRPLGWDWRIGCAAIASFPAREVVIASLGIIYNLGDEQEAESETLHETLRSATWDGTDQRVYSIPVALSVMVFFALCAQCASTLVVMRRETGGWKWPALTFVYMTTLAYLGALLTFQIGSRI